MPSIEQNMGELFRSGGQIFRFDTFGDERFWSDTLKLNQAIGGVRFGGVGPGVSPATALAVGLKLDVDMVPRPGAHGAREQDDRSQRSRQHAGADQLEVGARRDPVRRCERPAADLRLDLCVLPFDRGRLLCARHRPSARRLAQSRSQRRRHRRALAGSEHGREPAAGRSGDGADGVEQLGPWKVRRRTVSRRQGVPSRRQDRGDADSTGVRPRRRQHAHLHRLGQRARTGTRLSPTSRCTAPGSSSIRASTTRRSSPSPRAPGSATSGRAETMGLRRGWRRCSSTSWRSPRRPRRPAASTRRAAEHGQQLFNGSSRCSTCHVPPLFTEPGWAMHTADEIGIDDFQANRSPDHRYRTTPLKGLWAHARGRLLSRRPLPDPARRRPALQPDVQPAHDRLGNERSGGVSQVALKGFPAPSADGQTLV